MASPANYTFKKDGKTDDSREMTRFINDGGRVHQLAAGQYALVMGPGQLGVLPGNARFLNTPTGILLIVS